MSYVLEVFGRNLPDSLWPVFRDFLNEAACGRAGRPRARTGSHVLAGVTALEQAAGGQARQHFERALSGRDRTPAAIIGMACALDMLGQSSRARRYLTVVLNKHPEDAKLHYALGLLEERCGQAGRAAALYQRSVYFQPHQKGSRFRLMALAMAKADYTAAVTHAEALATGFPQELTNWTRLGGLQLLAEDPTRALQSFQEALKLLADNWRSQPDTAGKHHDHADMEETISRLERRIASGSDYADLHVRLGDLYGAQGRSDHALQEYQQALRLNPCYLEATTKVAAWHIQMSDRRQGAVWLARALEINETILAAYVGLTLACAYVGKDAESREHLEMARGMASNAPVLMAEIARLHVAETANGPAADAPAEPHEVRALHRSHALRQAVQTHLAWLSANQDDASAWGRLGLLLEADRQHDYAREAYAKACETYPASTSALVRLGLAAEAGSDTTGASMLRRAFWPEQIDLGTHYSLAVLFSQSHRFEAASDSFRQGLSTEQNQCFWRNVAFCLEQMGMLNRPRCLWQALTEIQAEPVSAVSEDGRDDVEMAEG